MDIKAFLLDWIVASNSYDTEKYLEKYLEDVVLDDLSIGREFKGHKGVLEYYTKYFIGYQTQTRFLKLHSQGNTAHLEVEFTGTFPERKIHGMFDFIFRDEKIAAVKADLMNNHL
jgi:ketosteroid isomerase-like protein